MVIKYRERGRWGKFTPYKIPIFNFFTAFFAVTLLPSALIGAIKDIFSRK